MRRYYDIDLTDHTVSARELHGEAIVKAGRYLIAKTLVDMQVAQVDPLSPGNPLIFSAGPFAGTSFSNANRTSVGCKSACGACSRELPHPKFDPERRILAPKNRGSFKGCDLSEPSAFLRSS